MSLLLVPVVACDQSAPDPSGGDGTRGVSIQGPVYGYGGAKVGTVVATGVGGSGLEVELGGGTIWPGPDSRVDVRLNETSAIPASTFVRPEDELG